MAHSGKDLTITAKGNLTEEVKEGAMIHLQVKYGYITLINQQVDLCEQVKEVDLKCPLKKGEMELTKTVQLPKEIPPVRRLYIEISLPGREANASVAGEIHGAS